MFKAYFQSHPNEKDESQKLEYVLKNLPCKFETNLKQHVQKVLPFQSRFHSHQSSLPHGSRN